MKNKKKYKLSIKIEILGITNILINHMFLVAHFQKQQLIFVGYNLKYDVQRRFNIKTQISIIEKDTTYLLFLYFK